jgi:hypothetical protein
MKKFMENPVGFVVAIVMILVLAMAFIETIVVVGCVIATVVILLTLLKRSFNKPRRR